MTATPPVSPTHRLGSGVIPPAKPAMKLGCAGRCRCHRQVTKLRDFRLSTFRAALGYGALSFGFSPQLSSQDPGGLLVKNCRGTRSKWIKIAYTLPAWLFHATIPSVFSHITVWAGRVCPQSVPTHPPPPGDSAVLGWSSIHGYIAPDNREQVRRMLQMKEGAVTDIKVIQLALIRRNFEMVGLLCQGGSRLVSRARRCLSHQYALQLLFANPRMSEVDRRILQSLMPFDAAVDRTELSDLHMIVVRVLSLNLDQCLQLRSCHANICDGQNKTPFFYAAEMGDAAGVHTPFSRPARSPTFVDRESWPNDRFTLLWSS